MTWLTWRQQRAEALMTAAMLAVLAALVVVTGLHMRSVYSGLGLAHCNASSSSGLCTSGITRFDTRFSSLGTLLGWLNFVPALIGILFAVPIVLELEHGTYRLSWTQSVTRRRWIAAKLGGAVLAVLAATLVLALLTTWWRAPWDSLEGRWQSNTAFNFEGLVPFAYALFALGLALAIGTLTRRVGVLVAGAIVGFLAVRLPIQFWLRSRYLPPVHRTLDGSHPGPNAAKDWILQQSFASLKAPSAAVYESSRRCFAEPQAATAACLHRLGFVESVTFQPASRFWIFQGIESAIFVGLAVLLLLLTAWWVRSRVV
jgi:hypothetical protein